MVRTILAGLAFWLLLVSPAANAVDAGAKPPQWPELSPQQQQILAPVAQKWNGMTPKQRFKLLGVAKHYPKMTNKEQQRVQARLKDWESLTPEQRERARKKYQQFKQLPPEKRQEVKLKWQQKAEQQVVAPTPPLAPPVVSESLDPVVQAPTPVPMAPSPK